MVEQCLRVALGCAAQWLKSNKKIIARWHGKERQLYCVTLSSKPISTLEHIQMTGVVWYEHPETYLQSYVSEQGEIRWVKELYPERKSCIDIYGHSQQLGLRSSLGYGAYLTEQELKVLPDTGTSAAVVNAVQLIVDGIIMATFLMAICAQVLSREGPKARLALNVP
jgi:guanine deaminase